MAVNNFKELQKEQVQRFEENTNRVGKNIKTNINNLKFVGSLLELYITTAINFLVGVSGASEHEENAETSNKYPNN